MPNRPQIEIVSATERDLHELIRVVEKFLSGNPPTLELMELYTTVATIKDNLDRRKRTNMGKEHG